MSTILIVDDHAPIRQVNAIILQTANYKVILASNGMKTLQILCEQDIDVLVLDLHMPGMSGFEVLKELRVDGLIDRLKVIILSAGDSISDKRRAYALGAHLYLSQPVRASDLLGSIQLLLS